jgi:hypothetical protein
VRESEWNVRDGIHSFAKWHTYLSSQLVKVYTTNIATMVLVEIFKLIIQKEWSADGLGDVEHNLTNRES